VKLSQQVTAYIAVATRPAPAAVRGRRSGQFVRRGPSGQDGTMADTSWDREALRAGVAVTVVFAAPFQVAARLIADHDDDSPLVVPLVLLAVLGFVAGAGVAAWLQRTGRPLSHGLATSIGTFVVVQAVLVIAKLLRGSDVRWFAIFFNLTVTMFAGLVGGLLGMRLQANGIQMRRR
jgi:hypothetical protein